MTFEGHDLASLLRRYRASAGLTQEELAERAGISARTISDVERGLRWSIYADTADRLAAALQLHSGERAGFVALARGRRHHLLDGVASRGPGIWPTAGTTPLQATRLLGRERELILLLAALKDPDQRLLTLTGSGGIGKTRLAVEASILAQSEFGDGVFFVSLAGDRNPARVAAVVVRALAIPSAREPLVDAVVEYLEDRACLLILDTFEQVLEAAAFVAELLERCRRLKVLVTSREALHLRTEHEFPVPTLAVPSGERPTREQLTWYPATALFLERTRAVKPDLVIDGDAAEVIAEICLRLNGLPLAIELAAARVRHLPLPALRRHLDRRLQVLTGGARDLPMRQRTMSDTVAWSYDLLDPAEQSLFRLLSVFAGGWTLESAGAVCMPDRRANDVLGPVSALIDKSLVVVRQTESEEPRYDSLDVIREYAAERLQELGESDAALRRHAEYFLSVAEAAERGLGRAGQEQWFLKLDTEFENHGAAVRWAIGSGEADLALRLCGALWQFWRSHGDYAEGRTWLRDALAIDPSASSPVRAKALWGAAGLAYHHGDYTDAERLGAELLPLARRTGEPVHMRNALTIRGVVNLTQRRFSEAVAPLQEALDICRALGPNWLLGTSHLNLGAALMHSGEIDGARSNFQDAVKTYRDVGDRSFAARARQQLGYLELQDGHDRQARSLFQAALETYRELDDPWGLAEALEGFSALSAANGIADRAARLAGAAETFREAFGARPLPTDRVTLEHHLGPVRASTPEEVWVRAWNEGRSMTLEQALSLAAQEEG
jgi:predicted ATPase/transcriptional regulator with XRE-family HTH domain